MSTIGIPCLAMLLVLANIALCLTAQRLKLGGLTDPSALAAIAAIPLAGEDGKSRRITRNGVAAAHRE